MPHSRRSLLRLTGGLALVPLSGQALSQAYPSRPIRLVVPFPPGGAFDTVGRPWAEAMKLLLGTVVVENIGGAGSSLGASSVARAQPDGYTILLGGTQTHLNEALLKSRPNYDPVADLDPIAGVASYPLCIAVQPTLPAATLGELVTLAKGGTVRLSYGHAGVGSIQHLAGELFKTLAGTPEIIHVPYRGTGPAITDLIAGQIPMAVLGLTPQVIEFHKSDRMRVLAVTGSKRLAAAPDLPTAVESGLPGLSVTGQIGVLAPARTPPVIIEQVAQATRSALAEPAFRTLLANAGMEAAADPGPEALRRALAADIALWAPVVRSLGLKLD